MSKRDNFTDKVKRSVAARAGWVCSFRGCGLSTVGPSEESTEAVTIIGEAAHICAAAPGGRRYDEAMTASERADISNAIWLCSNHAKLIDRDEATFTPSRLHDMKREHEESRARVLRLGERAGDSTQLVALGDEIVCTADVRKIETSRWTLRLGHFLIGDVQTIGSFIAKFDSLRLGQKYILCGEFGEGRTLDLAPSLEKDSEGYLLVCSLLPSASRIDVQNIGSGLATHPETNDLYLDAKGNIARASGLEYFPQRLRETLSMQRGENVYAPYFGMRFFEYFDAYKGSPLIDRLFQLDVIRQASIPHNDVILGEQYTPLRCVTRVNSVELLADEPSNHRLPIRVDLQVQGLGRWQGELLIYMPTAEQVAERAKLLEEMSPLLAPTVHKAI